MTQKNQCGIIGAIAKFQLSGAYPVIFALLCVISGLCDKRVYIPILVLLGISVLFSAAFVKDGRALLVPMFMMYYALGTDNTETYEATRGDVFASIDQGSWNFIVVLAITLVVALTVRFSLDGTFKNALRSRGPAFLGIIVLDLAFLSNGLFFEGWTYANLLLGLLLSFFITAFYLIFCSIFNSSEGIITYVCKIMLLTAYIAVLQILPKVIHACAAGEFIYYHEESARWIFDRSSLYMSWGIVTIIGGMLILGIPCALYLAKNERFPILYSSAAVILAIMPIILNTRASMLGGALLLLIGAVSVSVSGKNKRLNRIFFLSVLAAAILGAVALFIYLQGTGKLSHYLEELMLLARFDMLEDRLALWGIGERHFLENPAFGIGMLEGASVEGLPLNNFFANMYHNILVQFVASMGIVGIAAFLFHVKDLFLIGSRKGGAERIPLLLIPAAIIILSLADNFFFYPNFQIFYAAFLALAEKNIKKNGLA